MDRLQALRTTTPLVFLRARSTLDKKQMTTRIPAIDMRVRRLPALMTPRDDLSRDALSHPVVKDKILPTELVFKALLLHGIGIVDDAALEMKDIAKSLMQEIGARLLAPDAPGAVHDDGCVFLVF